MMRTEGFAPEFDEGSRVLILGSFPSVKSRAEGFYYGNPQNRFWRMLSAFFGVGLPRTVAEKRALLHTYGVALWDMVASCEIEGSADAAIRAEETADISRLAARIPQAAILCNGAKAYALLILAAPELAPRAKRLPSTSPANPRYSEAAWHAALREAFQRQ